MKLLPHNDKFEWVWFGKQALNLALSGIEKLWEPLRSEFDRSFWIPLESFDLNQRLWKRWGQSGIFARYSGRSSPTSIYLTGACNLVRSGLFLFWNSQAEDPANRRKQRSKHWVCLKNRVMMQHWFPVTSNWRVIWCCLIFHASLKSWITSRR
jgi:hypothetical protein